MTILRRIIILYISSLIAYIIISKLFGGQIAYMLKSRGFWLAPLFIIAVGQIIGFVTAIALEKPQLKQKIFNTTYLLVFLGFVVTTFYFKYTSWRHKKDFGNIEANQDHFKSFGGQYSTEEKIAFDSLSKLLIDPNSFELTGGNINSIDTILNGDKQAIFFTTFRYKKNNQQPIFKAKFAVINNTAQLIYIDIPLDKEDNERIDSLGRGLLKEFKDAMKVVPDSIKKGFGDIINR